MEKIKRIIVPAGIQTPDRPASGYSLYRLRYPGLTPWTRVLAEKLTFHLIFIIINIIMHTVA